MYKLEFLFECQIIISGNNSLLHKINNYSVKLLLIAVITFLNLRYKFRICSVYPITIMHYVNKNAKWIIQNMLTYFVK